MSNKLVAYFSASGVTGSVAEKLADETGADLFEIIPEKPYTNADLDWQNSRSRSSVEMKDRNSRPAIASKIDDMSRYDVIFVGFPIWWGDIPRIMSTFAESYDFGEITMIPFCTSGGSGVGQSDKHLEEQAGSGKWLKGTRLQGNISEEALQSWISEKIED